MLPQIEHLELVSALDQVDAPKETVIDRGGTPFSESDFDLFSSSTSIHARCPSAIGTRTSPPVSVREGCNDRIGCEKSVDKYVAMATDKLKRDFEGYTSGMFGMMEEARSLLKDIAEAHLKS